MTSQVCGFCTFHTTQLGLFHTTTPGTQESFKSLWCLYYLTDRFLNARSHKRLIGSSISKYSIQLCALMRCVDVLICLHHLHGYKLLKSLGYLHFQVRFQDEPKMLDFRINLNMSSISIEDIFILKTSRKTLGISHCRTATVEARDTVPLKCNCLIV